MLLYCLHSLGWLKSTGSLVLGYILYRLSAFVSRKLNHLLKQ